MKFCLVDYKSLTFANTRITSLYGGISIIINRLFIQSMKIEELKTLIFLSIRQSFLLIIIFVIFFRSVIVCEDSDQLIKLIASQGNMLTIRTILHILEVERKS